MKTMIEVQYQEKNVKDGDLDKYVKETLKEQGVKTTEVETLNIYYLPCLLYTSPSPRDM